MRITWKAEKWHKAPLLCRLFGHSISYRYPLYAKVDFKAIDGVNTIHMNLIHQCDYCGRSDVIGHFHLNSAVNNNKPKHINDMIKSILIKD